MAYLLWSILVLLSVITSVRLANFLPFSSAIKNSHAPIFLGGAISPFLLGFAAILALKIFPEYSHNIHIAVIFGILIVVFAFCHPAFIAGSGLETRYRNKCGMTSSEKISAFLILAFATLLLANTIFTPLMQNDALEYAQMGRIVFDSRTLASYPPIIPENHSSSFYSPVTHPPLYVALIHVSYLLQGSAETPYLMKLIDLWVILAATGLVFATGSLISRRTGLFSALLFISTPLLFMGASRALIDPLMVLGFCLVFSSIFLFAGSPWKIGIAQGIILGIAMWTHSEAVLFPILLVVGIVFSSLLPPPPLRGRAGVGGDVFRQILALTLTSLAIGIWPYIDNYHKLGSFVSDSPLIFQLKALNWQDYFLIARGVDSLTAQIQYGLFKGWFTPEAYGIIFWVILAGLFSNTVGGKKKLHSAIAIIIAYHAGVVLAIFLGINQLFRIERYMLVIMPCLALVAGFVLDEFSKRDTKLGRAVLIATLSFVSVQLLIFVNQNKLLNTNDYNKVATFINENIENDSIILTTLVGDSYYFNKKIISNLDPRLVDFYKATNTEQGWQILKNLGISHIYIVPNAQPTFYNSELQPIVSDNRFSKILYNDKGYQIYEISNNINNKQQKLEVSLLKNNTNWQKTKYLILGGRKAIKKIKLSSEDIESNLESETKLPFLLFHRDFVTALEMKDKISAIPNSEYRMSFNLNGYGLLRFWLYEYDGNGDLTNKTMLTETTLSETYKTRDFAYRFQTTSNTKSISLAVEHYGNSKLQISNAEIQSLTLSIGTGGEK